MKYCEFCGKELNDNEQCTCAEAVQKNTLNTKKLTRWLAIGLPVLLVFIILLAVVSSVKVDAMNFVSVSFEGIDGNGKAVLSFDKDELIEQIIGPSPEDIAGALEWYDECASLSDDIKCSIDQTNQLSNGDTVTVTITVTDTAASDVKGGDKEFVVSGLESATKEDVFENITVAFSGRNGEGVFEVTKNIDDEFYAGLSFSLEDNEHQYKLSNGDTVEVVVSYQDSLIEEHKRIPQTTTKTYTVSGLPDAMEASQVPDSIISDIKDYFNKNQTTLLEDEDDTYSNVKYHSTYYYTPSGNSALLSSTATKLIVYYSATQTDEDNESSTVYIGICYDKKNLEDYNGVVLYPDGKTNIVVENGKVQITAKSFEEVIVSDSSYYLSGAYTATKID